METKLSSDLEWQDLKVVSPKSRTVHPAKDASGA